MQTRYKLILFVNAESCEKETAGIRSMLSGQNPEQYEFQCVDVDKEPQKLEEFSIKQTPALMIWREGPGGGMPQNTFYSLDDSYPILYALGLRRSW